MEYRIERLITNTIKYRIVRVSDSCGWKDGWGRQNYWWKVDGMWSSYIKKFRTFRAAKRRLKKIIAKDYRNAKVDTIVAIKGENDN